MKEFIDFILTGLLFVWSGIVLFGAVMVIWAGVLHCPKCGHWHCNPDRERDCKGQP